MQNCQRVLWPHGARVCKFLTESSPGKDNAAHTASSAPQRARLKNDRDSAELATEGSKADRPDRAPATSAMDAGRLRSRPRARARRAPVRTVRGNVGFTATNTETARDSHSKPAQRKCFRKQRKMCIFQTSVIFFSFPPISTSCTEGCWGQDTLFHGSRIYFWLCAFTECFPI